MLGQYIVHSFCVHLHDFVHTLHSCELLLTLRIEIALSSGRGSGGRGVRRREVQAVLAIPRVQLAVAQRDHRAVLANGDVVHPLLQTHKR